MEHRKTKKEPGNATRAKYQEGNGEAAYGQVRKNRGTEARYYANSRTAQLTMPGTVDKIIPSPRPSQPEKAQIAVRGADHRNQDLRIENTLTDEHGDDVKLKKGAHVDVTVSVEPKT